MIKKIISGGQTGADRAALDAGFELNFPIGGFCPKGRIAEDGVIDDKYKLVELQGGYAQRTKANIEGSDGTVVFYEAKLSGGTKLTANFCNQIKKPCKLIDISLTSIDSAVAELKHFTEASQIVTLNVAGPRASGCSTIYAFVKAVISLFINTHCL